MRALIMVAIAALTNAVHAACPQAPQTVDEVVAAAACFDRAREVDEAITAYELVAYKSSKSKHAMRALWRAAELLAQTGRIERAAARFEDYALRYGGEPDAFAAIERAIAFRAALGDRRKQIRNTGLAASLGAKRPRDVAALRFALRDVFDGDERTAHLARFLDQHAAHTDLAILARVELGVHEWERACPARLDGLCARMIRAEPESCDPHRARPQAVPRDARRAKRAIAALVTATALFEALPKAKQTRELRAAYLRAKLVLAERDFETLLAMPFPKLSFRTSGASARSRRRFDVWFEAQGKRGAELVERYHAIQRGDVAALRIEATLRIAQFSQMLAARFLTSLLSVEMRRGPLADEKRAGYCEALAREIAPLDQRAFEAFAHCASHANQLGVHDWRAARCMRALEVARPEEHPVLREKVASVGWIDVALEREADE